MKERTPDGWTMLDISALIMAALHVEACEQSGCLRCRASKNCIDYAYKRLMKTEDTEDE